MRPLAVLVLAFAPFCGACHSPKPLPAGRGLVAVDTEPPDGATRFGAPRWSEGDRFVYRRAGLVEIPVRVELAESGYELVNEVTGQRTVLSPTFGERGERAAAGELSTTMDPEDASLSWPLWVGKRWGSEFTRRASRVDDLPLVASYLCDAEETVQVPAGTFRALRIWRRARLAAPGRFPEHVSIAWYAPEIGAVVRRITEGVETVLVEASRR
jgi:hypothetical protein